MRILMVEPYYGASHRALVEGLISRIPFEAELLSLSPRKWKWRMRGGAWVLAEKAKAIAPCSVLFASDFLDLSAFLAMGPAWLRDCKKVVYFHENQLTYPVRVEDERDFHFGLTNIETALVADTVVFNSEFHRRDFVEATEALLKRFPDNRPSGIGEKIARKSIVLPVPMDLSEFPQSPPKSGPSTILWNMRWEFDKAPEAFFRPLFALAESGLDFRVAVAGESFQDRPAIFDEAEARLADKIVSWGFLESRRDYLNLLSRCDVVVSTAIHEFFGIAVAEAVAAGCFPLLPNRLAYPERYPKPNLYDSETELRDRLRDIILDPEWIRRVDSRPLVRDLDWKALLPKYQALFTD
ncbi:DUF3524 domain-containing protein [bacterium]|nr:DUF3524 domain-containing protein [bacterium]